MAMTNQSHKPLLSRRQLLASFLAAPAIANLTGCGKKTPSLPPGTMVGASAERGHRIRSGFKPTPKRWIDCQTVIVGGGVAGLTAARRLDFAGATDFVILELEDAAGGNARSGKNDFVAYPWGAHYLPAPMKENQELIALLEELDCFEGEDERGDPIVAEHLACRDPEERIFFKGIWQEGLYLRTGASENDLQQFAAFEAEINRWVSWRDGDNKRAFTLPLDTSSRDPEVLELDKITMADWMELQGFDSGRLLWWVNYACRDDYGMTAAQTSAWAGLFYFASRVPVAGGDSRPFIVWPEGNGRLISHLQAGVKDRLRVATPVMEIIPHQNRLEGEGLLPGESNGVDVIAYDTRKGEAIGFRAQAVIFSAPQFLSRWLIKPWVENPPQHIAAFEYGSWAVANLTLKERPFSRGFPLAWDNVLYDSKSLGYVTATHQRGPEHGPTVLTWYYPLCDDTPKKSRERLLSLERDDWAEIALADLQVAHQNIREITERIDVVRWGHAMIRPVPGFIWSEERKAAAMPYRGIHFAHSDLSGVSVFEEAFHHGNRAAEEVIEALGYNF